MFGGAGAGAPEIVFVFGASVKLVQH